MKIGINLLLWTGHVTDEHMPALEMINAYGFDGVEVPVFNTSDPLHYRRLGARLDDLGLQRTSVAIMPDAAHNPASSAPAERRAAIDHLLRVRDCMGELGATVLAGPWFQPLGLFSGDRPTEIELDNCAHVHQQVLPRLEAAGIVPALEPLNRFEAYLLNTCAQAVDYCDRVGGALGSGGMGILYDTFHANIEERDPVAALRELHASGHLSHVHISENDRGTPGAGHAPIRETIAALNELGYDGWLTIEAFGRAVPELAAATRVWRDFFASPEEVCLDGIRFIRRCLETSA